MYGPIKQVKLVLCKTVITSSCSSNLSFVSKFRFCSESDIVFQTNVVCVKVEKRLLQFDFEIQVVYIWGISVGV